MTNKEIAEILHCNASTVTRRMQTEGRRKHRLPLDKRLDFDFQAMFLDYQSGMKVKDICNKYDLSESVFRRTLREHNIPNKTV